MRGVSNIIVALGLVAVATVAVVVGFTVISQYLSQALRPRYDLSISYAKLVFITDSENVGGTSHTTFKGEVGVANPSASLQLRVCILSAKPLQGGGFEQVVIQESCVPVSADPGYNVYSFIIRVPNSVLEQIGCSQINRRACPYMREWFFVVYDSAGNPIAIAKPTYVVP